MCDMLILKAEIKSCSYAKHVIIPGVYIFICLYFKFGAVPSVPG